ALPILGLAVELRGVPRPGAADDLDAFFQQAGPVAQVPAEGLELRLPVALADAEVEPAAAEQGQGGGVLGEADGVVQRGDDQVGADLERLRAGGDRATDDERRRRVAVGHEVVLGEPQDRKSTRLNSSHVKISYA